jgi:hypothetical protein
MNAGSVQLLVVLTAAAIHGFAQSSPKNAQSFEVASIRRSQPGNGALQINYPGGGRLTLRNWPLYSLIGEANGLHYVLVQREMESWRSPLASIPPFSARPVGRTPPKAVAAGGTGRAETATEKAYTPLGKPNWLRKNLESTPRQVFQQAVVPGHKADSVGPPGRG